VLVDFIHLTLFTLLTSKRHLSFPIPQALVVSFLGSSIVTAKMESCSS